MYYNNNTLLYLDGKFVKANESKIDLYSQTLHYGYGVFEGIRAYATDEGTKLGCLGIPNFSLKQE